MEYIIYCDESDKDGLHFANFYGGVLVGASRLPKIENALETVKTGLGLKSELKWEKVTTQYLDRYTSFIDEYFNWIRSSELKIRIMFTHRVHRPIQLTKQHRQDQFFILYYQFVKYAFGLNYSNPLDAPIRLRVYFDKLPDKPENNERFKGYILGLNRSPQFRKALITLKKEHIGEVDSHKHVIMQGLDIILGSIAFRLNDKHKQKLRGGHRGKRTIAKECLYKFINKKIREIYPHFNVGITTGKKSMSDIWGHAYRHWCFKPKKSEYDKSRTKNKKKQ